LANAVHSIAQIPQTCCLSANYPNPFNASTQICFQLSSSQYITLDVYTEKGERIVRLLEQRMASGRHALAWDGCDAAGQPAATGIYFYVLRADKTQLRQAMTLLR
jgi:hypothetical protein